MHRRYLGCAALALALAVPGFAADTLPANRARMYARPSGEAWQAVLDTLTELKLKPDKIEPAPRS